MKYTDDEPVYEDGETRDAALRVEALAQRLSSNYPVLLASLMVAHDPRAFQLLPNSNEWATIERKNSIDQHGFAPEVFLAKVPTKLDDFKKAYMADALIVLADALDPGYFGHDPALEMVYHLRNGVAHGNMFHFTTGGRKRLAEYPAHTRDTWRGGGDKVEYEITDDLHDQKVLFEFMLDGDILDLIHEVAHCMRKKATGLPIKPIELR